MTLGANRPRHARRGDARLASRRRPALWQQASRDLALPLTSRHDAIRWLTVDPAGGHAALQAWLALPRECLPHGLSDACQGLLTARALKTLCAVVSVLEQAYELFMDVPRLRVWAMTPVPASDGTVATYPLAFCDDARHRRALKAAIRKTQHGIW